MPGIRTIRPEFWTRPATGKLSSDAKCLLLGIWNHADLFGVCRYEEEELQVLIFPYDRRRSLVRRLVQALVAASLVVPFDVDGDRYVWSATWASDQRIDHPERWKPLLPGWTLTTTPSSYPRAVISPSVPDHAGSAPGRVPAGEGEGEGEVEGEGKNRAASAAQIEEVWNRYLHHHPTSILNDARRKAIAARLAEGFTPERLCKAIDGNHISWFHTGHNDREKKYHELTLILRDAQHVEEFEDLIVTRDRERLAAIEQRRADLRLVGLDDVIVNEEDI